MEDRHALFGGQKRTPFWVSSLLAVASSCGISALEALPWRTAEKKKMVVFASTGLAFCSAVASSGQSLKFKTPWARSASKYRPRRTTATKGACVKLARGSATSLLRRHESTRASYREMSAPSQRERTATIVVRLFLRGSEKTSKAQTAKTAAATLVSRAMRSMQANSRCHKAIALVEALSSARGHLLRF